MRRLAFTIGLLVVFVAIEIAVVIAVGQLIGAGWTLLLLLATSGLGAWLLRAEGGRAWRLFQADVADGRPPGPAATDGLLILVGGVLMLVPGFVSDVIGLLCIAPPTRAVARRFVMRTFATRISPAAATSLFGPRRVRAHTGGPTDRHRPTQAGSGPDSEPIEGEIVDP